MTLRDWIACYLTDLQSVGSEILPTERTIDYFETLAQGWQRDGEGSVILEDYGFAFGGSLGEAPFDHSLGRVAYAVGVYVRPEERGKGLAMALKMRLRSELLKQGFDTLITGIHYLNRQAQSSLEKEPGVYVHQLQFIIKLDEES
jgi:L-amino acid N-acyltransferase YncA